MAKFHRSGMVLILKQLISNFLMEKFLAPLPMLDKFRNFVLREYVLILVTSAKDTNFDFYVISVLFYYSCASVC